MSDMSLHLENQGAVYIEPFPLTDHQLTTLASVAQDFAFEMRGWRLNKHRYDCPPISGHFKHTLASCLHELVTLTVGYWNAHKDVPEAESVRTEWLRAQAGAAAHIMDRIRNSDDIRTMPGNAADKDKAAMRFLGSVVNHTQRACRRMGCPMEIDPTLFGMTRDTVKAL